MTDTNHKTILQPSDVQDLAYKLANVIRRQTKESIYAYAIPRGGIPVAYAVSAAHEGITIVDNPTQADIFIDDIIDSGTTRDVWGLEYPDKPFYALIDKQSLDCEYAGCWVVFPWEAGGDTGDVEANIQRLLQYVGENPEREGLLETPRRVAKAWGHWCSGYNVDIGGLLKVFEDGAENYDQMVTVKDIPFYSKCEHHMADIFGTVTISYIPNGKIVGLSKLARLADAFARRLQVQERLTAQIADALVEHLNPKGVGVLVRARHMCMESRGICQQGHSTITTALRGVILTESDARSEFLELARS